MTRPIDAKARDAEQSLMAELRFLGARRVPFSFQIGEWQLLSIARPLAVFEFEAGLPPISISMGPLPDRSACDGYLLKGVTVPIDSRFRARRPGWVFCVLREYPRHLVDLTMGFDAYMAKFSSKSRSTLNRKIRRIRELSGGTISWREYRSKPELAEFFPLARRISEKTYQERLLDAGLPNTEAFRESAFAMAEDDAVRAYILFLDSVPVSYLFLPVERGRVVYAYLGYDPAHARHSPGTVLQLLALERLFAEPGLKVFDFTEGAGQHKDLLATHHERCADVLLLKRGTPTVLVARAHSAFRRVEAMLAWLLERLGLRKRLKLLLRRLVSLTA
jgi:hypothetical protein